MFVELHVRVNYTFPEKIFFFGGGGGGERDYFTHFELSQSLGGAIPEQNHLTIRKHWELGLSHIWPELGSNAQR